MVKEIEEIDTTETNLEITVVTQLGEIAGEIFRGIIKTEIRIRNMKTRTAQILITSTRNRSITKNSK